VQLDKGRLGRALLARRDWEAYFDALPGRRLRGREDG
jgi:hypothetical protein